MWGPRRRSSRWGSGPAPPPSRHNMPPPVIRSFSSGKRWSIQIYLFCHRWEGDPMSIICKVEQNNCTQYPPSTIYNVITRIISVAADNGFCHSTSNSIPTCLSLYTLYSTLGSTLSVSGTNSVSFLALKSAVISKRIFCLLTELNCYTRYSSSGQVAVNVVFFIQLLNNDE